MTAFILNSSHAAVYPSAFQWLEKPLYYLNESHNKTSLYKARNANNLCKQILASSLENSQCMIISYLCWPIIICATPFTALIDIGIGVCEAFYAKYKGATSHQISLIIQKKMIASPIQHLAYVITNLAIPLFFGSLTILAVCLTSFSIISPASLLVGSSLFATAVIAPSMAFSNYHFSQKIIDRKLPAWIRPEGFNIFINGGSLDCFGHKITAEDYTNIEASFYKWAKEHRERRHKLQKNKQIEPVQKCLQDKIAIVNAYQNDNFKFFFNLSLKNAPASDLLQLKPGFQMKDIKKAYLKWSLILHPDKHIENSIKVVAEILFKSVLRPARLELEINLQGHSS